MALSHSQHISRHVSDLECVNFPLEKFSFALSPLGATIHKWVHDGRSDELFLLFRRIRLPEGTEKSSQEMGRSYSLILRVLAGTETLEDQDLGRLSSIAREFENRVQMGLVGPTVEVPVQVVVRLPCIAVRYPVSASSVRRAQMRFKNDMDYHRALEVFKRLNFSIKIHGECSSSNVGPVSRPFETRIIPPLRSSSTVTTSGIPTAFAHAKIANSAPRSLSAVDSSFKRPQTASSGTVRPDSVLSMKNDAKASALSCQPSTGSNVSNNFRPPNSSIFISQLEMEALPPTSFPAVPDREDAVAAIPSRRPLSQEQVKNVVSEIDVSSDSQVSPYFTNTSVALADIVGLKRATSVFSNTQDPECNSNTHIGRHNSTGLGPFRPVSAPATGKQNNLNQWVPPRRELPFVKAREKSRPSTSELPLLPQPTLTTQRAIITDNNQNIVEKSSAPNLKEACKRIELEDLEGLAVVELAGRSQPAIEQALNAKGSVEINLAVTSQPEDPFAPKILPTARPSTAPVLKSNAKISQKHDRQISTEDTSPKKLAKTMVDRATQTQTLSGRDHTVPLSSMLSNERSGEAPMQTPQPPPEVFMDQIDQFVSKYKNRPAPQEVWLQPDYLETSPEERQSIINDFICDNLDNEDFIKLCEDTANVWRRIGLGTPWA